MNELKPCPYCQKIEEKEDEEYGFWITGVLNESIKKGEEIKVSLRS